MKTKKLPLLLLTTWHLLLVACILPLTADAQSAFDLIERNHSFAAGSYGLYPETDLPKLTPAPDGYEPFYISHYGRHGSRYLNDMKGYIEPYKTLQAADSLGKLTPVGQMALREIRLNIADAEGRWGDLADKGKQQQSRIAHRMLQNFPQVFNDGAFVDARSTIVTRCALSMGTAVLQLVKERPNLEVSMNNSYSDMWYLNHQNKSLRDAAPTRSSQKALTASIKKYWNSDRVMNLFFNDIAYAREHVDALWFIYYIMKASLIQQNTERSTQPNPLLQLFSSEDLYIFWQVENIWSYIQSGFCELNGAKLPYLQVYLLQKMIDEADSIINSQRHGASLRFGHETVILPLACLMGINGLDLRTSRLEELEQKGWWANTVCPMAGNVQIVFYRKNVEDRNPLIKVLLNEKEATLPLPSDLAPYYQWSDFHDFYLKRIAEGESVLSVKR